MPKAVDDRPSSRQRGYNYHWEQVRAAYLRHHPLCVMCLREARITQAQVVDHIVKHKGLHDPLLWDRDNLQALCYTHHNSDKQRIDKGGTPKQAIGVDGWPIIKSK